MKRTLGVALALLLGAGTVGIPGQSARADASAIVPCNYTSGSAFGTIPASDDNDSGPSGIALPFGHTLNFYGGQYDHIWVNNNGNITFKQPQDLYIPLDPAAQLPPTIAPFDADIDTRGAGSGLVHWGTATFQGHSALCVLWGDPGGNGVGYFARENDKRNFFQLLIVDRPDRALHDFDAIFNYGQIQWENADGPTGLGGTDGCGGGEPASAGFSAGDGNTAHVYRLLGSATDGAFLDSSSTCPVAAKRAMRHGLSDRYYGDPAKTPGRFVFNIQGGSPLRPGLGVGAAQVVEGDAGPRYFRVPVTLSVPTPSIVSFRYSVVQLNGDTATQDVDFQAVKRKLVTIPQDPGINGLTQTTVLIPITVYGDTVHEGNETFTVQIDAPTGATIAGPSSSRVTIIDDDPWPSPHIDVNSATIVEGNQVSTVNGTNKVDVTVSLTGALPSGQKATVDLVTKDGTAIANEDYTPVTRTLTFVGGGTTQQRVLIGIVANTCHDGDEQFVAQLQNVHGAVLGPLPGGVITIKDDDPPNAPSCS
jgi:hypothetical protein